jgi:glycosyltransferase involved in cell wall biosynthesis
MLPDLQIGGGQRLVLRNILGMREAGAADRACPAARFDHAVCAVRSGGEMEREFRSAGVDVLQLGVTGFGNALHGLRLLTQFVRQQEIGLIHTNNTRSDRFFGQLAALRFRLPLVTTLHAELPRGIRGRQEPHGLKERLKRAARNRLMRATTRKYVAVSRHVRDSWWPYLRALGTADSQVEVVLAGLESSATAPGDAGDSALARREIAGGSSPVLLYVARMVPGKGHDHLISVMRRVLSRWPRARLVLAGDGPTRGHVQRMFEDAALSRSVSILGHRADVNRLLAACDLFVFPSISEGFGLAVLEAMAAAKPVVCFDLPVYHEFVEPGRTSLLAPLGDGEALADAVVSVLADPSRLCSMGDRGRAVVEERFQLKDSVERLASVYAAVLDGRPRHRPSIAEPIPA